MPFLIGFTDCWLGGMIIILLNEVQFLKGSSPIVDLGELYGLAHSLK
jgi:hypothetical protein